MVVTKGLTAVFACVAALAASPAAGSLPEAGRGGAEARLAFSAPAATTSHPLGRISSSAAAPPPKGAGIGRPLGALEVRSRSAVRLRAGSSPLGGLRSVLADPVHSVRVASIEPTEDGKTVDVCFAEEPETTYRFHSLWLRDACMDDDHVVGGGVGERVLTATPVGGTCKLDELRATGCSAGGEGQMVEISWNDASSTTKSAFDAAFLRAYAGLVAKPLSSGASAAAEGTPLPKYLTDNEMSWLRPYTGFPDAPAPAQGDMKLWSNIQGEGSDVEFRRFEHDEVLGDAETNLAVLKALAETGVAMVDNVPEPSEDDAASSLKHFLDRALGGLQKDPTRDEPNWQITKKVGATSISYDHDKRLNAHTDQSVPPHGLPGVVLSMNYVSGQGCNTLVDGFAVARKMREVDPEAFDLLTRYGYDAERDFVASRVDSEQNHYKTLIVSRKNRIFELDADGEISKIMYNEVFRTPAALPFELFPKWFAALELFNSLIHNPEFERTIPMKAGTILLMNNWRILHGRVGGMASFDRKLVGGTITRESYYSTARTLVRKVAGYDVPDFAF